MWGSSGTDAELHKLYSSSSTYSNSNWSGTEELKCRASLCLQKRNRRNFCKTIWFAVDNWELKAQWHPHCGIINVHFLAQDLFFCRRRSDRLIATSRCYYSKLKRRFETSFELFFCSYSLLSFYWSQRFISVMTEQQRCKKRKKKCFRRHPSGLN